jgi:RimJ/RimL family protein N-acetyltransferase
VNTPLTTLRAPLESDFDFLASLRNDIELQLLLASRSRPNTAERVREWTTSILSDPHSVFFVIADAATAAPRGYVQLVSMDFVSGVGKLGICLEQSARGQGYARDAMTLLCRYAKDVFGLRKIVLEVLGENARAIAFYEKFGFSRVGTLRGHFYHSGVHHDVLLMERFLRDGS